VRTPNLLIIGTKADDRNLLERCRTLGIRTTLIQRKKYLDPRQVELADELLVIDYTDHALLLPVARTLHGRYRYAAVLSLTEPAIIAAATVNDDLGLGGTSLRSVELLQDKWAMRKLLAASGVSPVHARAGTGAEDVHAFVREVGFPVVVKPVDGGGSVGVTRVDGPDEVELAVRRQQEFGGAGFIVEEFLEGREVSVEAFSFAGAHHVVAVTDKLTGANFVELGHSMPSQLPADVQGTIVTLVGDFLDVVGLRNGPSHTEIIVTPNGPRIVESHNRIGGDKINDLVRAAYGIDLAELTFAWACGLIAPWPRRPQPVAGAAIRFFAPARGVVKEVRGADDVRRRDDVVVFECKVAPGDGVAELASNYERAGCVAVKAASAAAAVAACERYLNDVVIVSE
jgi:biotin carboxylase